MTETYDGYKIDKTDSYTDNKCCYKTCYNNVIVPHVYE